MVHPRSKSSKATRTADFKNLSSEVLRLRLQSLNLPITGSRTRLVERLRVATNSVPAATPGRSRGRAQNGRVHKEKPLASNVRVRPHPQPNVPAEQAVDAETRSSDEDEQSDIDSAVDELFEDFEPQVPKDAVFSPAQMSAIQETVSTSVNEALRVFHNHKAQARFPDVCRTQRLLWACIVPWKKASKTKYSAVSTLTFVCYCPTSCIAPRPPLCSYATRTRPRAPRAPR